MSKKPRKTDIRQDILDAIRKAHPDGIIYLEYDEEESYLYDMVPALERKLRRIKGTTILYERPPAGEDASSESEEAFDDSMDEEFAIDDLSYSYYLYHLGFSDPEFSYETDTVNPDDEDVMQTVAGVGWIGCSVAVSVVAPFAVITLCDMEFFDDGSRTIPDIPPSLFGMDGKPLDMDEHYRETMGEAAAQRIRALRDEIAGILDEFDISVMPEDELCKPVPGLRADPEVFAGLEDGTGLSVQDAFFYRGP